MVIVTIVVVGVIYWVMRAVVSERKRINEPLFSASNLISVLVDPLAYYVAFRAIKLVFDDMDGRRSAPFPIERVWLAIKEHFSIVERSELLPYIYKNFDKSFVASLCKRLADLVTKQEEEEEKGGDPLIKYLFHEAGCDIARNIQALLPKVHPDLIVDGDLNVICVGSLWLSWPLLAQGFLSVFESGTTKGIPFGLKLLQLTKTAAFGACYSGADRQQKQLPRNYQDNYEMLFHLKGHLPRV